MLMAAAQTVLQVCGRGIPSPFSSKAHLSRSWSGSQSRPSVNYKRRKAAPSFEVINRFDKSCKDNVSEFPRSAHSSFTSDHFGGLIRCNCERAEGVRGYSDNAKDHNAINGNRPNVELDKIKESISESAAFSSNGGIHSNGAIHDTLHEGVTDSIEEEAWDLLRESIVYYCNTPVGTIAAKDPSESTNILNYDHVFIRDFIPSGIAFLLKGEYDIIRNFLLHTLQLQVNSCFLLNIALKGANFGRIPILDLNFKM